jgi:hypothetical protein
MWKNRKARHKSPVDLIEAGLQEMYKVCSIHKPACNLSRKGSHSGWTTYQTVFISMMFLHRSTGGNRLRIDIGTNAIDNIEVTTSAPSAGMAMLLQE